MTWNPNASYWTLFWPKYWAASGAGRTARNSGTSASPQRRNMSTSSGGADPQLRCVTPEPLELIEGTSLRVEQMNHEIHKVQQHPATPAQPLGMMRVEAAPAQLLHHRLGDAAHMRFRRARGQHEEVRRIVHSPEVQHHHRP